MGALALSLCLHVAALLAALALRSPAAPAAAGPPALAVALLAALPAEAGGAGAPASRTAPEATAPAVPEPQVRPRIRRVVPSPLASALPAPRPPARARAEPEAAEDAAEPLPLVRVSEAGGGGEGSGSQAGSGEADGAGAGGGGGGGCDLRARLEAALGRSPSALSALRAARAESRRGRPGEDGALLIWNGDWLRSGLEDGKGLATVREVLAWEVAFSPPACRQGRRRGLIVLKPPGSGLALALGAETGWRWADLTGLAASR